MALLALVPYASTALIASGSEDATARFWDETTMMPNADISVFNQVIVGTNPNPDEVGSCLYVL